MTNSRLKFSATCAIVVSALSGCVLPIDRARPTVEYENRSDQTVVFTIEGTNSGMHTTVASGHAGDNLVDECVGTGIRVETESGQLVGRIDKQACPNWTLTVNEDGTLDYVKDK